MWIVFLDIDQFFNRAFEAAKEMGAKVLLISTKNIENESIADKIEIVDQINFLTVSTIVTGPVYAGKVFAFWALSDKLVPLSTKLNIHYAKTKKYYSEYLIKVTKNKYNMRESLKMTDFNPKYTLFQIKGDCSIEKPVEFKDVAVVVKPLLGYASIGVEKVEVEGDFKNAITRSASVLSNISSSISSYSEDNSFIDQDSTLLIEELVSGEEYSVEIFCDSNGMHCLGICSKSKMKGPFFEEVSYQMPANIEDKTRERLKKAAIQIMQILELKSGMAHLEFIINDQSVKILDIGLRLGGSGLTHELVYLSSGIDIVKHLLAELLEIKISIDLRPKCSDVSLLYLIQIEEGGKIARIPIAKQLIKFKEYIKLVTFVKIGETICGYPNYSGLPGYVLFKIHAQGLTSFNRAIDIINEMNQTLKIGYAL